MYGFILKKVQPEPDLNVVKQYKRKELALIQENLMRSYASTEALDLEGLQTAQVIEEYIKNLVVKCTFLYGFSNAIFLYMRLLQQQWQRRKKRSWRIRWNGYNGESVGSFIFFFLQLCVLFLSVNNCFSWPERISHVNVCCCYCGFVLQRDNDSRRLRDSKADELTAWSLIDITVLPDNVFSYIFDNFKAFGSEIYHPISTSFGLTENYISFSECLNREIPIQLFVALLNKIFQKQI